MGINSINATQKPWATPEKWPTAQEKEPLPGTETQKLAEDLEKEESELKRINKEFSEHLSKGEQDMAEMKSAEITQKQMQIQALRTQIDKLENPGKSGEPVHPATAVAAGSGRAKFDQFVKSDGLPKETPGIYSLEKDEDGNPKIVFDAPESVEEDKKPGENAKEALPEVAPPNTDDKKPNKKPEDTKDEKVPVGKSVGDDSAWQAEIAQIKQKRSQISQQIKGAREDAEKRKALEAQLAQVEAELASKDTDSYRKQRTKVTYLGATMVDKKDLGKYR